MSVLRGSVIYDNITPPDLHQTPFSFGLSCLEHVTGHMTTPANPRPPHRWCRLRPAGARTWTGRERRRCRRARERPPAAAAPSPPRGRCAVLPISRGGNAHILSLRQARGVVENEIKQNIVIRRLLVTFA